MLMNSQTSDGHDTSVSVAGKWCRDFLEPLIDDKESSFWSRTLVLITFDESETYTKSNRVFTMMLGDAVPKSLAGTTDSNFYNHYSEIATVGTYTLLAASMLVPTSLTLSARRPVTTSVPGTQRLAATLRSSSTQATPDLSTRTSRLLPTRHPTSTSNLPALAGLFCLQLLRSGVARRRPHPLHLVKLLLRLLLPHLVRRLSPSLPPAYLPRLVVRLLPSPAEALLLSQVAMLPTTVRVLRFLTASTRLQVMM
jgi:hypothetical protein